jgi:Immunoglobulin-like domain of bacterial spore germination
MIKAIYFFLIVAITTGVIGVVYTRFNTPAPVSETGKEVMCTMDAMQCPDGSFVGRTGPKCEFVCPTAPSVSPDVQASLDAKADLIVVESLLPGAVITNGMTLTGKARGGWFFEASFPVSIVNWDGLIIAEAPATALSDWMTSEFVPFSVPLNFISPYKAGDPDFMKRGAIILQKDNPSGLPENDDALEIPITFAP